LCTVNQFKSKTVTPGVAAKEVETNEVGVGLRLICLSDGKGCCTRLRVMEWREKCGRDGCALEKLEFVPFIMLRCSLIVLGLIAAATAVPINPEGPEPISDAPLFNTSSGYNPGAAVAFAKANCGSSQGLCAEFASRSMAAGGAGNPVITWVPDLVSVTAMLRCSHRLTLCAINSRLPAVDGRSRLENDRNAVLRPRRLCRHLRRDVLGQRPRRLLSGRRPHLPAQPRPLQARFMAALILRALCRYLCLASSHVSVSFSTSGNWGKRRVYCKGC